MFVSLKTNTGLHSQYWTQMAVSAEWKWDIMNKENEAHRYWTSSKSVTEHFQKIIFGIHPKKRILPLLGTLLPDTSNFS